MKRWIVLVVFSGMLSAADPLAATRQPVALILHAQKARLYRSGYTTHVEPLQGDLLFPNDSLETADNGAVEFLFCPTKLHASLPERKKLTFTPAGYRPAGSITELSAAPTCLLPPVQDDKQISLRTFGKTLFDRLRGAEQPQPFETALAALGVVTRANLIAELNPLDEAIRLNANDMMAHTARAATLEKYGFDLDAATELQFVAENWKDAVWTLPEIDRLHGSNARGTITATRSPQTPGQTFALLVGISNYRYNSRLRYAAEDATSFAEFLKSPRGGSVPKENIVVLTDSQATEAAIEQNLVSLAAKAGPNDALWLLFAAHGVVVDKGPNAGAYILTVETDPQRPEDGLPMQLLQELASTPRMHVRRMEVLVDACHAGAIGHLHSTQVQSRVDRIVRTINSNITDADAFALLGSDKDQLAYESSSFGGGHGAFTYFVLRGLNGEAAEGQSNFSVDRLALLNFVDRELKAVRKDQTPVTGGASKFHTILVADVRPPGIVFPDVPRQPISDPRGSPPIDDAAPRGTPGTRPPGPGTSGLGTAGDLVAGSFDLLSAVADILHLYLRGDEINQPEAEFQKCADYLDLALSLTPESAPLRSKHAFCEGRVRIFQKNYPEAIRLLERAVRLDPLGSWSYNALGIAYLETARYADAIAALQDAIRLSPYWAYPRHNLALAKRESGDFEGAIQAYKEACRLADYGYLRYNLGLVYHQVNQPVQARELYVEARDKMKGNPKPLIGLALLDAQRGRPDLAIGLYEQALNAAGDLEDHIAARHDMALLLVQSPKTFDRAVSLWRSNIEDKKSDPSAYISLGDAFAARIPHQASDFSSAARYYQDGLDRAPDSITVAVRLVSALTASGDAAGALRAARTALEHTPADPMLLESLGDAESASHHLAEARSAYSQARQTTTAANSRKRISKKMAALGHTG